jgi:hypothetical protein
MITFSIVIEDVGSGMARVEIRTTPTDHNAYTDYTRTEELQANMIAAAIKQVIAHCSGKKLSDSTFN